MMFFDRIGEINSFLKLYTQRWYDAWHNRDREKAWFSVEEAEFLPPVLAIQEKPISPTVRLTFWLVIALVLSLIGWAIFGSIDITVSAVGKILPSGGVKTIGTVEVARVQAIHVVEGQQVRAGDVLIVLDGSVTEADRKKALIDRTEAILQVERAKALVRAIDTASPPRYPNFDAFVKLAPTVEYNQWATEKDHLSGTYQDLIAKLNRLDVDISRIKASLPLITARANDFRSLLETHDVARHSWIEKEQERIDLEGQLRSTIDQRRGLLAEAKRTAYDQIADSRRVLEDAQQDAARSEAHSEQLVLKSPVDGTVQELSVHTIGGVVSPEQAIMEIVPADSKLEIEAFIPNRDIGFVKEEQTVQIKIDAFDFTKYGTVSGRVAHISHDSILDANKNYSFKATIEIDSASLRSGDHNFLLAPGMTVTTQIKTGERKIIDYALSTFVRHKKDSFHER